MKALLVPVSGECSVVELNGLDDFQKAVGGSIEAFDLDDTAAAFVNEDGKGLAELTQAPVYYGTP